MFLSNRTLLSTIGELRSQLRERQGQIADSVLEPLGRLARPHNHSPFGRRPNRPGRPKPSEDEEEESHGQVADDDLPAERSAEEEPKTKNRKKPSQKGEKVPEEPENEDAEEEPKRKNDNRKKPSRKTPEDAEEEEDEEPKRRNDNRKKPTKKNPQDAEEEEEEPKRKMPTRKSPEEPEKEEEFPSPFSSTSSTSTTKAPEILKEDWSNVKPLSERKDDDTDPGNRRIITAPCLGGITKGGDCREAF